MAAPEGNQFWKLRSKHGRDLLFSSPTIMWEAACEYFEAMDKRVWVEKDWVGKDAKPVEREKSAPYTLSGLYIFLDTNAETWSKYRKRNDFVEIVTRIENIIFTQKFEGAAVGAYNASIIARDLGLADKKENKHTVDKPIIIDWSENSSDPEAEGGQEAGGQ